MGNCVVVVPGGRPRPSLSCDRGTGTATAPTHSDRKQSMEDVPVVIWPVALAVLGLQVLLRAIQALEQLDDGLLVGFLRGGEAGFVDAVVDVVVGPFVGFFDLGLEILGEEVQVCVLGRDEVVETGVEHAEDFGGFVVYLFSCRD